MFSVTLLLSWPKVWAHVQIWNAVSQTYVPSVRILTMILTVIPRNWVVPSIHVPDDIA